MLLRKLSAISWREQILLLNKMKTMACFLLSNHSHMDCCFSISPRVNIFLLQKHNIQIPMQNSRYYYTLMLRSYLSVVQQWIILKSLVLDSTFNITPHTWDGGFLDSSRFLFACVFLQQYFSYIVAISFIGGGNRITRRKPSTWRKSLTTLSHNVASSTTRLSGIRTFNV